MEAAHDAEVLRAGPLEVRPAESLALAGGRPLTLSVREYSLLVELARRPGRIVSRDNLYELVWRDLLRPGDRSVDVYIHKLRSSWKRRCRTGASSTPTSASATASPPSLHMLFTSRPQLRNRLRAAS